MSFNIDKVELEEAGRHWRAIITPEVKDFVKRALDLRGSKKQVEEANRMLDLLLAMLRKRKQIVEGVPQPVWVDVMLAAGLLHNLYYLDKKKPIYAWISFINYCTLFTFSTYSDFTNPLFPL